MKFSIKDFFSKCDQIRTDLGTFPEEIRNGKLHSLCSVKYCTNKRKISDLIIKIWNEYIVDEKSSFADIHTMELRDIKLSKTTFYFI